MSKNTMRNHIWRAITNQRYHKGLGWFENFMGGHIVALVSGGHFMLTGRQMGHRPSQNGWLAKHHNLHQQPGMA